MSELRDLTAPCIRCGFCLESCPTYLETGHETESPRGRIYLVRSAEEGRLRWTEDVQPHLDRCLGCLACEPACPSGVHYGAILELARAKLERARPRPMRRRLLSAVTGPAIRFVRFVPRGRLPGWVSQRLAGAPPEADLPRPFPTPAWPPLDDAMLPAVRGEVALLTGCAMGTLFPRVHAATERLLRRIGFKVRPIAGCCGALHRHNGHPEEGARLAAALSHQVPTGMPLVVNSAGCGASLRHGGPMAGHAVDASVFLLREGLAGALKSAPGLDVAVTCHDACHLAHGQGVRSEPRELLDAVPGLRRTELPESDLCCGSAGVYNVLQPAMARRLVERKLDCVNRTGAQIVVLGNPGCHAWIAQAARERGGNLRVFHTMELLEFAFGGKLPTI